MLVALCVATITSSLVFALPAFVPLPVLWYHPVDRDWTFETTASGIAMDFYGRCLWASLAALTLGGGVYRLISRFRRSPLSSQTLVLFTVWAITLTALVMVFFVWRLAHRVPVAPPMPPW
jgi:hypothetical protein